MSAMPKPTMTAAEYLAKERAAEFRSEFLHGKMFAMAGASYEHTRISNNLIRHLGNALDGGPCHTLSHDMRVHIGTSGLYTYPDIIIQCDPPEYVDGEFDTLLNPRVILEILSPSTERYDRGAKFRHYQQLPTLAEYVLVSQDEPLCERFVRGPEGTWILHTAKGLESTLAIDCVRAAIPLADIYTGLTFDAPPARS